VMESLPLPYLMKPSSLSEAMRACLFYQMCRAHVRLRQSRRAQKRDIENLQRAFSTSVVAESGFFGFAPQRVNE